MYKVHKCFNPSCNNKTNNPKFCNRSCASVINNREFPKRHLINTCDKCGVKIRSNRKYCKDHNGLYTSRWKDLTLGYIRSVYEYQPHSRVRITARKVYMQSNRPKSCEICGYALFFHVCHKRPIYMFSNDVKLSVINDIDNLIALCPNHHTELDNGYLII